MTSVPRSGASTARDAGFLQRVTAQPLNVLAYDAIRRAIIAGQFGFGDRLAEGVIAESLGMSRQPVREALIMLRNDGLVVDRPRSGTFVCDMGAQDFIDLYNVRVPLEVTAARLLVRRRASVAELDDVLAAMRELVAEGNAPDVAAVIDLEFSFHRALMRAAGNQHLLRAFESVSGPLQLALTLDNTVYDGEGSTVDEHEPVLSALRGDDEHAAAAAVHEHIAASVAPVLVRLGADVQGIAWPSSYAAAEALLGAGAQQ